MGPGRPWVVTDHIDDVNPPCGGHHGVGQRGTETTPQTDVSLRNGKIWYDLFIEHVDSKVSLLQRQSRTKKSEPATRQSKTKKSEPATMVTKYEQHRHSTPRSLPTSPRDSKKNSYGTSPMAQRVHDTWMESWKAVCSTTVPWHKKCMNTWMKAGWLIGFAILRSTGYWVWDVWRMMDCGVMWQECQEGTAASLLQRRMWRVRARDSYESPNSPW